MWAVSLFGGRAMTGMRRHPKERLHRKGDLSATAASNVPDLRRRRPDYRSGGTTVITGILSAVAAQLAGLTVAAKATIGIGVATAAIGTASVVGVVPVPGVDTGGSRPAAEVQLPSVPTAEADLGLQTADDAISATAGQPEVTGLDRAAQTPAAEHLPSFVPGPPAGVPSGGTVTGTPGATGTGIAGQTPAAGHLPR
jgi:hypothetical protein